MMKGGKGSEGRSGEDGVEWRRGLVRRREKRRGELR